ncbi:MAG: phage portal protein, partial [Hyphomonadaceae bacterium]|nr:phage portal protein [Clostridia bacterium]
MGVFDYFKRDTVTVSKVIELLGKGHSLFSLGKDIYSIPEIRTAVNFIAEKVATIPFYHIRADTSGKSSVINDRYQFVLNIRTNPMQSPFVFFTQLITRLLVANNCFAMPEWGDNGDLKWIYLLPFTCFQFDNGVDGKEYITFTGNGGTYTFPYEDILHFQRFPTERGGIKTQATGNYVKVVDAMQNQAVKDMENSGRLSAVLTTKVKLNSEHEKAKLKEFIETFKASENSTGLGMISGEYGITPLNIQSNALDTKLLNEITRSLYNYFGVSTEIINGNATEIQYEQFVDNTLKPIVKQIEQEFSYKLFSNTEIYHYNRIQAELVDLEVSNLSSKTMFFDKMLYHGV